ncbi:helix-turn-helix transcriptional regulator [Gordonibacter sp. An230]|nr:helix-turn-helix transcriptional regulator [Gordonibacter sp. An230]
MLWPLVLGLAFSRAGLIVASYGSYASTDQGMFTDGAMLVALAVLAAIFAFLLITGKTVGKRATNLIARICIALEALCLFAMAALKTTGGQDSEELLFALSALCTLVSSGAIFYWLRRARGTSTTVAVLLVFSALIVSEAEIFLCALLPDAIANLTAMVFALVQYPCMLWARKRVQPYRIASPTLAHDYFSFAKTVIQSRQLLAATAIGIGCLSIVIGLLRGYPNGEAIAFSAATRMAYGALTVVVSSTFIVLVLMRKQHVMTAGAFIVMELLACLALIAYAAFPDMLDIGAVFTTTLNALMVAFTWYVIIAFMSHGWRDPYYYAIAAWLVWLGCRALSRVALMEAYLISANDMLMSAVIGGLLVLSTQVVFVQFLAIALRSADEQESDGMRHASTGVLAKLMALDENESMSDLRQASMQHNAEEMGKQFLLSEREVEVLTLYALGHTQKRVAEELFITQGTAHAHIKRIYAKTGLHSRQEIIDYLGRYAS